MSRNVDGKEVLNVQLVTNKVKHPIFKAILDIAYKQDPSSVDLSPCGHQKNWQRKEFMDTSIIGTTILGRVVTTVKSMDTSLRTA